MPLDHYVRLGNAGLAVSPFCLGTMTFGEDWGWGSSEAESVRILDRYLDAGGNFVDTANFYTRGHSEAILGKHLAADPAKRDRVVLATKFFCNLHPGDPNAGGASRGAIHRQVEASLRRLRTDRIDLYWMHAWDRFTPIEETMRALDDLVRAGKVRYLGFSDTPAWKTAEAQMLAHFRGWTPLVALQVEYSLLERGIEGELVPMAREMGLGITPWSPLRQGVLTGKYRRGDVEGQDVSRGDWLLKAVGERGWSVVEAVQDLAKDLGATPAQVALAWVQGRPGVASTILGARTMTQLEDNLAALEVVLPDEARTRLDELSTPKLDFPAPFLEGVQVFARGGCTLEGESWPVLPLAPDAEHPPHGEA